jgi:MoaA/NifB/PqqE/SkfB family radical SAM enzyme
MWKQKSYNELTTEEVNEILVQLKKMDIRSIGIAGGEPLLRKDLIEIVKKANDLKFDNIHIVTNGLLLTRERAENLIENGLRGIAISIDGTVEVNDCVRGIKGSYERNIKTLKMLTELRDNKYSHLDISIRTTLMKPTLNEIIKVINVAKELNVKWGMNLLDISPYFFKDVDAFGLLITDQNKLNELINELHKIKIENPKLIGDSHASIEYARKYLKNPKREDIPCYLGYLKLYIGSHGEVYSGCSSLCYEIKWYIRKR